MSTKTTRIPLRGRLMWVPIAQIKVNPVAQRELDSAFVDKLVASFDPDAVGVVLVNKKDGTYHVIDGQHRVEMFCRMGWNDQQIQCEVFEDLTDAEEAVIFRSRNTRRAVTALADYRVAITAGDVDACEIDRVVRASGLTVTGDKSPGGIRAVGALRKVYNRSDSATLGRTLRILRDAYGDSGLEGWAIDGIGLLCQRYNGQLSDEDAVRRLGDAHGGVNGLLNRAESMRRTMGQPKAHCVAASAVEIINRGRGGKKLPDWWKS